MSTDSVQERFPAESPRRTPWWTWTTIVGAISGIVALCYILLVEAPAPRSVVFAAGASDGRYFSLAESYALELRRHGIEVTVLETRGSEENAKLLSDPNSGVSVALVQGGIIPPRRETELRGLGSLYREPFWVFVRKEIDANRQAAR